MGEMPGGWFGLLSVVKRYSMNGRLAPRCP